MNSDMTPRRIVSPRAWAHVLFVYAVGFVLAGAANAEDLYRWKGSDGSVHFGSTPPSDAIDLRRVDEGSGGNVTIVPGTAPTSATDAGSAAAPGERLEALEAQEPKSIGGLPEWRWRRDAKRLERNIERLQSDLEAAEERLSSSYTLRDAAIYKSRVDRLERELADAERAFEEFEDHARELGVPPGWLR